LAFLHGYSVNLRILSHYEFDTNNLSQALVRDMSDLGVGLEARKANARETAEFGLIPDTQ